MNNENAQDYRAPSPVTILEVCGGTVTRRKAFAGTWTEAATTEPENGVYMVARTYRGGMVLDLDAHFDRMERSAALLRRRIDVPRGLIRSVLNAERTSPGDIRFRVTAVLDEPVWYRLTVEEARDLPATLRTNGVVCGISRNAARENPIVKGTAWIHRRTNLAQDDGEVYEHLLTDLSGNILEGTSSNFYAMSDGVLRTAGEGVLEGTARKIILSLAREFVPIELVAVTLDDLAEGRIDEAWISSSTRGVVPVRRIDTVEIGAPGPIATELIERWDRWMGEHLSPLVRTTNE